MAEKNGTEPRLPHPAHYFAAAGILGAIGAIGFNATMLVLVLAVPAFLAACLSFLVALFRGWAVIRNRAQILLSMTLLILVTYAELRGRNWMLERDLAHVVSALEAHRTAKGFYPDQVEKIVPEFLQVLPQCPRRHRLLYFRKRQGPEGYDLTCVTFGFNKHSYDSITRAWRDWD